MKYGNRPAGGPPKKKVKIRFNKKTNKYEVYIPGNPDEIVKECSSESEAMDFIQKSPRYTL